jgi:Fe-S cluster biogenesis protein NfuA
MLTNSRKLLLRALVLFAALDGGASFLVHSRPATLVHATIALRSQPQNQKLNQPRYAVRLGESPTGREGGSSGNMGGSSNPPSPPAPPSTETPAPVLNGKRVLPFKIMVAGLKGAAREVAATYAILGSDYKKKSSGDDGWEVCQHIGVTRHLERTLRDFAQQHGGDRVAHVRALSFAFPNENAMESIASSWRKEAKRVGGKTNFDPVLAALEMDFDEDDDDDDDVDDDYFATMSSAMSAARSDLASARGIEENESARTTEEDVVVSPFDRAIYATTADGQTKAFTKENVDKVLDEVRPYLISDGGNCRVEEVDVEKRNVYLVLEGACGSCPSSTITMQMGIERVLKENFSDFGQVIQVQEEGKEKPTELTYQAVELEVNRIKPAIIAMGGLVDIVNVDPIGVVELKFRGANKIRQGLELALLDVDFVKHVKFLMDD